MERLLNILEQRTKAVCTTFVRYLFSKIDWQQQLIIIKGARGAGRTVYFNLKVYQYLNFGDYPFFKSDPSTYHQKLQQILQLTAYIDIPAIENINYSTMHCIMKRLFYVMSQIIRFTSNIQKLADKTKVPRNSILKSLNLLQKESLLNLLQLNNKGVTYLQKLNKTLFPNTNFAYSFSDNSPNKGNLREIFFFNQLDVNHSITSSKFADFMVGQTYTFEVRVAMKANRQIAEISQAFIAANESKNGFQNKIPFWLFNFLY